MDKIIESTRDFCKSLRTESRRTSDVEQFRRRLEANPSNAVWLAVELFKQLDSCGQQMIFMMLNETENQQKRERHDRSFT